MAPDSQNAGEPLQFDSAIPANASTPTQSVNCANCKQVIHEQYFEVNGHVCCTSCKEMLHRRFGGSISAGALANAIGFGLVAAILGAIAYYLFMKATNLEFALVTLAIGYMVGYAVRKASKGRGGMPFQVVAVVLTYLATGLAYVPFAFSGATEPTPFAVVFLALSSPVFVIFSGVSGILSAIIIFVGLRQAWRMNAAPALAIRGPYRIASSPAA